MRSCLARAIVYLGFIYFSVGCVSRQEQYHWGEYQDLVYQSFEPSSEDDPKAQVDMLKETIEEASNNDKDVPPGIYAHLGYMQHTQGQDDEAEENFKKEMIHHPSSKIFMTRLLDSLRGNSH